MLNNERGFALLNVIFLTMITSFAAMILMNAAPRIKNPDSTLRLTAIYLVEEQFAELESLAANGELFAGSYEFRGDDEEELTTYNFSESIPVEFSMATNVTENGNLRKAKITISWTVGEKTSKIETERTILFVQKEN